MRINEEDGKIILEGDEGLLSELSYLCGAADAYLREFKRVEKQLKEIIRLREKENGKEK